MGRSAVFWFAHAGSFVALFVAAFVVGMFFLHIHGMGAFGASAAKGDPGVIMWFVSHPFPPDRHLAMNAAVWGYPPSLLIAWWAYTVSRPWAVRRQARGIPGRRPSWRDRRSIG